MENLTTRIETQLANTRMDSDVSALRRLSGAAGETGETPASSLRKVSRDFESVFIRQLLEVMRKSIPKSDFLEGGMAQDVYTSMMDTELAGAAADGGGIGLASLVFESLVDSVRATGGEVIDEQGAPLPARTMQRTHAYRRAEPPADSPAQVDRRA